MARSERTTHRRHALPASSADRPLCRRLIVELDGGHHNDDATAARDSDRQAWLEQQGYRVIRFWNSEVTGDLDAVMEKIYVEMYGTREAEARPLKHHRRR